MATKSPYDDDFTGLGPGAAVTDPGAAVTDPGSELDQFLDTRAKIKQSKYKTNTSTVAPIVEEKLVKIDDDLFKKVLFFMLFSDAISFDFSDRDKKFDKIKFYPIAGHTFLYKNENEKKYFEITGFVETIIVFCYYLKTIDFYKHGVITQNDNDIFNFYMISNNSFFFTKKNDQMFTLAYFDIDNCKSQLCYDKITLEDEGNKTYITQTDLNTLSNYVALLEKLIAEEIVIELKDGELFANNTKIGFKNNLKNKVGKLCRNTFASSATIHMGDDNTKLYDTILSVFRNSIINARYGLEIYDSNLCGGRNNKTRKRHRNKASHKKMRKSHNIRKRKTTGKKRK